MRRFNEIRERTADQTSAVESASVSSEVRRHKSPRWIQQFFLLEVVGVTAKIDSNGTRVWGRTFRDCNGINVLLLGWLLILNLNL